MKSDAELVRLAAQHVMGWEELTPDQNIDDPDVFRLYLGVGESGPYVEHYCPGGDVNWYPLTDDADSCDILDKMAEAHEVTLQAMPAYIAHGRIWICEIGKGEAEDVCCAEGRRRVILLAALKAVGVDVE